MPITLTPADARALQKAAHDFERARETYELAVTRARVPFLEAATAKSAVLDRIAEVYGLDLNREIRFDPVRRTIEQEDAPGAPFGSNGAAAGAVPTATVES